MLKGCWRVCQVEGRHVKFKQFFMACKRCFLILFAHSSLPVARFQIQSGKVSTPRQLIKTVVYSWQGSTTLFSAIIESTVINPKSDATVFFLTKTIGLDHRDLDVLITPSCSISSTSLPISCFVLSTFFEAVDVQAWHYQY